MKNGRFDRNDYYFQRSDPTPWIPISEKEESEMSSVLKDFAKAVGILLIFVATLAVSEAKADTWVAQAEGGGEIVLTGRTCQFNGREEPTLKDMYLVAKSGQTVGGCWAMFDGKVQVIYEDDRSRWTYDPAKFTERKSY